MPTAPDVVSSIFRKYEKQELSPEFIRDESNNICDILEITRYGDPGRTARMFAEQGYVAKVNGTCKYDPDAIPLNKKYEFEKYLKLNIDTINSEELLANLIKYGLESEENKCGTN